MNQITDEITIRVTKSGTPCGNIGFVVERIEREILVNGVVVNSANMSFNDYASQNDPVKTLFDHFIHKSQNTKDVLPTDL